MGDDFIIVYGDMVDNLYTNLYEIAGDGKDNDGNCYTDHFNGWNQGIGIGVHDIKSHGTNITGVLGAKGNNSKGIVVMNWYIKLLPKQAIIGHRTS